jgi:bifunctional NMN adenylyltransferase/nudix hydrolase
MKEKVGVIIGRFQVDELHNGHKALIDYVSKNNDKLIIFIGLSPLKCTYNNPLDFSARERMLKEAYPKAKIMYIKDELTNKGWSENLDKMITDITDHGSSGDDICLYGSRDSFINYYHGNYKTQELEQTVFTSGTARRKEIANNIINNTDFRKGAIWVTMHQYFGPATTVDIAILNHDETKILLGRKEKENKFRFIGGFAESNESFEQTAHREVLEETGVELINLHYIKSIPVDDWRYKNEKKKITTLFFKANILCGRPIPGDDICELMWVGIDALELMIIDVHKPLAKILLDDLMRY